jgi:hypothetical protein
MDLTDTGGLKPKNGHWKMLYRGDQNPLPVQYAETTRRSKTFCPLGDQDTEVVTTRDLTSFHYSTTIHHNSPNVKKIREKRTRNHHKKNARFALILLSQKQSNSTTAETNKHTQQQQQQQQQQQLQLHNERNPQQLPDSFG